MGQKVNPRAFRLGNVFDWQSHWFGGKNYRHILLEDYQIRKSLMKKLKLAGIARVEIDRSINSIKIMIFVSRPGLVIGRAGTGLEELKKFLLELIKHRNGKNIPKIDIRVEQVKDPNLDAYLVAQNVSDQLIKRLPPKRILNQSAERTMNAGAKGVRIILSGRVGGAEIARREKIQAGTVPLSTLRERIDFASNPSLTKKGYVGVKVWINRGE